jgi:protein-tyrosine phosphatase
VTQHSPAAAFTVLLVCTGNICRSALGERLGRAFLDDAMGKRADVVRLVSAGTGAVVDSGMHPDSALVLQGLGAEPGDFRARQLDDHMPYEADLVLTMTRSHRRDVLHRSPRALSRTFTLREAADLMAGLGDGTVPVGGDFVERARSLVKAMAETRSNRHGGDDDDIRDPIQQPVEVHQEVGEAIADALLPVLRRIASLDTPGTNGATGREVRGASSHP